MSEYNHQGVYKRIQDAWESIGCKNAHEFSEYAKVKGITISEGKISNWKKTHHIPEISSLMDICNLCGCDIDFLLGKIPCKTHEATNFQKLTGLSEEAIDILMYNNLSEIQKNFLFEHKAFHKERDWFIRNGLLDILNSISNILISQSGNVLFYQLPEELQRSLKTCYAEVSEINETSKIETEFLHSIVNMIVDWPKSKMIEIIEKYSSKTKDINIDTDTIHTLADLERYNLPNSNITITIKEVEYCVPGYNSARLTIDYNEELNEMIDTALFFSKTNNIDNRAYIRFVSILLFRYSFDFLDKVIRIDTTKFIATNRFIALVDRFLKEYTISNDEEIEMATAKDINSLPKERK